MSEFDRNITPGIASSSLDFASLGRLRGQAQQQDNKAIKEAARQFESMFAQMMLKSMREASFKSDLVESNAMDTYQGMYDKELANQMSKRGTLGIADMLVRNFEQQRAQPSAAEVLASRDAQRARTGDAGLPLSRPQAEALPLNSNRGKATGFALPRPNQDGIALPGNDGLSLAPERARND